MKFTGVSRDQILAAKQAAMFQGADAELVAPEEPAVAEEDVDAALEALMGEVEDEPADTVEADEALPAEAPLIATQPAAIEPADEGAPTATQPATTQPGDEPATQPAAAAPAPLEPAPAPEPASAKKALPLLKRKPMLSVAKKSAKGRTAPEEPAPAPAPAAEPAIEEEPALQAAAEEPAVEEAAPAKPAAKPAAKVMGLAKPAAKPGAGKAPTSKPKAAKPTEVAAASEGTSEAPAGKGPKRACNAYFIFVQAKRAEVKAANPELDNKGVTKRLGEMWKELGADEKKEFEALAAADKERFQAELAAAGPLPPKEKKPRAKSAYQLYCDSRMADVKAANPKAGMPERSKLLAAEWAELGEEAKQTFLDQATELRKQMKAAPAAAALGGGGEAAPASKPQKKRKAASGSSGGAKRSKGAAGKKAGPPQEEGEEEEAAGAEPAGDGQEEEAGDAEAERMDVDWEAHPAVCILSETRGGKFVVLRQGVNVSQYGLVDAAPVRQQRLGGGDGSCPVSLEMLAEWEEFNRTFKTEVHFHSEGGELELEDLPGDSTLDSCLFLGLMREPGYALEKKGKHDVDIKVPLLATCQLVQRMLVAERRRSAAAMAAVRKELAHARATGPVAVAVAVAEQ